MPRFFVDLIMLIRTFDIEYQFKGETVPATCSIYTLEDGPADTMPYKFPLYRVSDKGRKINQPTVYLFWEVNEPGKIFFTYDFPEETLRQKEIKASIIKALELWKSTT